MKAQALVILFAITLGIVLPSLPQPAPDGCEPEIGTMDFCHRAAPAISSGGDAPCITEPAYPHDQLLFFAVAAPLHPLLARFLIPSATDHPPRY